MKVADDMVYIEGHSDSAVLTPGLRARVAVSRGWVLGAGERRRAWE